jgi:hypothetical protein
MLEALIKTATYYITVNVHTVKKRTRLLYAVATVVTIATSNWTVLGDNEMATNEPLKFTAFTNIDRSKLRIQTMVVLMEDDPDAGNAELMIAAARADKRFVKTFGEPKKKSSIGG